MKIVIFGLTITSTWGNGHATLWRGLCKALSKHGHAISFYERDVSYYAGARDLYELSGTDIILYPDWAAVALAARAAFREADVVVITSYCPDALVATETALSEARGLRVFYDLDTPITLSQLRRNLAVGYIGKDGLAGFDLVLSYTGGATLDALKALLGARRTAPLYGHVDPDVHAPTSPQSHYLASLSYLGTYAADRQPALDRIFVAPARQRSHARFLIGGAQYPVDFPWAENIYFVRHLPPSEHAAFFSSSRLTVNVTRPSMVENGWCPSGRLFEAAACQAAILSDSWPGLDDFFTPGSEILLADTTAETLDAMEIEDSEIARIGRAARDRVCDEHTSEQRAFEFEHLLDSARTPAPMAA